MSCVQLLATVNNASVNLHGMVSGEHVFFNPLATDESGCYRDFLSEYFYVECPLFHVACGFLFLGGLSRRPSCSAGASLV